MVVPVFMKAQAPIGVTLLIVELFVGVAGAAKYWYLTPKNIFYFNLYFIGFLHAFKLL